jgi:hypothetical protein
MQAPASTFEIPIVSGEITILAVSERMPTYWDFCFADASRNVCCWLARDTFPGITHSGDLLQGNDLLDYVRINSEKLTKKEICVFISGYTNTRITRFQGTHPALLVANHVDKVLIERTLGSQLTRYIDSLSSRFFTLSQFPWTQRQLAMLPSVVHWSSKAMATH